MKTYGKKILKHGIDKRVDIRKTTFTAVIDSINLNTDTVYLKKEGSDKLIPVKYPRNLGNPYWLKVGNAVTGSFSNGLRGRVEILGEGLYIPSRTSVPAPSKQPQPDQILSGFDLIAPF